MGIFTSTPGANVTPFNGGQSNQAPQRKPQAQVWINVGYIHEHANEDGEIVKTFIGLPMGIPVDTMEARSAGNSELMQAKNALLTKFKTAGETMAPGEERIIAIEGGLALQLRRVGGIEAHTAENNSMIASLDKLAV